MTREANDPVRNIFIDNRMSMYDGYIPDEWSAKTFGPVKEKSALDDMLVDLVMTWRTIAYTAAMPVTVIKAVHSAAIGRGKLVTPDRSIVAFADRIVADASQKLPELKKNRRFWERVTSELTKAADEMKARAQSVAAQVPIEPIWEDFLTQDAFAMALWSSQRVAYVAFYNAYEAFLVDCLKLATGAEQLRASDKKAFNDALRTGLSKDISSPCWMHHEVNIARLVRHALSHAGGRETADLKLQKHGIKIVSSVLQIVPHDNHSMLRRLRQSVEALVAVALTDPKFEAPRT